jgi:hypothetical protein
MVKRDDTIVLQMFHLDKFLRVCALSKVYCLKIYLNYTITC